MRFALSSATLIGLCAASLAIAAPANSVTLPSGVTITQIKGGKGASPAADSRVQVNYRGTLADGTEFDSSYKRNEPITFPLNGVIPCWTEGVQKMKVGEKAKLTCPADTAYGTRGIPGVIPPNSPLTFEVELLAIEK